MQVQHYFGNDIQLTSTGTIALSFGAELSKQAVCRRLLTNPGSYIWHPEYGAGIGRFVGQALSAEKAEEIRNLIISQMFLEATVLRAPEPDINFSIPQADIFQCDILYYYGANKEPVSISFQVS